MQKVLRASLPIFLSVLAFSVLTPSAFAANTFYVSPDGSDSCDGTANVASTTPNAPACAFATVSHAVATASSGDTINVAAGTYPEVVSIASDLTLRGAQAGVAGNSHSGAESTITGFSVTNANVTIDGFTINPGSSNSGVGIRFQGGTSETVQNNIITGYDHEGMGFFGTSGMLFQHNLLISPTPSLTNDVDGIFAGDGVSDNTQVLNNVFTQASLNNGTDIGLSYTSGANPVVSGNTSTNEATFVTLFNSTGGQITNNTVTGDPLLYTASIIYIGGGDTNTTISGNTISGASGGGVAIKNVWGDGVNTATTITGNTLTGNHHGIDVGSGAIGSSEVVVAHQNILSGNTIDGIRNLSAGTVDAADNWWGDATGPKNATTNPSANGNAVSDNVTYTPWLDGSVGTGVARDHNVSIAGGANFNSIQAAISAATSTDTINIGSGTYTEIGQIVINKDLTIVGANKTTTIIKPAQNTSAAYKDDSSAWILVNPGKTFNLSKVTLDGTGKLITNAILSHGFGTIDGNIIKNIAYNQSGPDYDGAGVALYSATTTVSNNSFSGIGREGIFTAFFSAATITGNTYTGKGDGNWLDYGFEVGRNSTATITGNTVSGNTGVATADGSTSAGILVSTYYDVTPGTTSGATITNNAVTGNTEGIVVGYDANDASIVVAHENNLSGNITKAMESTAQTIDAANNWWGTASSTEFAAKITGTVTYTPWYINPGRTVLNTSISDTGTMTVTASTVDFPETSDGEVELPSGTSHLTLGNDSKLDLSSSANSAVGDNLVISGATTTLSSFTSGVLSGVNLSTPQTIGGQTVSVNKAVKLSSGSTNTPILITNTALPNVSASIPDGTAILAPSGWDGTIAPPKTGSSSGTAPSGFAVGDTVIEVGSPGVVLLFDKPVLVTLSGVTGNVGYKPAGSTEWKQITAVCDGGYDAPTLSAAAFPGECYISNGTDTKILTFHFTSFGGLSSVPPPSTNGNAGGGSAPAAAPASVSTPAAPAVTPAAPATAPAAQGEVLGAEAYNFINDFSAGSRGTDVTALQQFLLDNKFYTGPVTGYFGPLTKAAVMSFQKARGIAQTGNVGPLTRAELNKGTTPSSEGTVLGATAYSFANNLSVGSQNADVTALQQFLLDNKFYTGPVTGYFGPLTKAAVMSFQKARGIAQTGNVGPLTRVELNKGK